MKLFIEAIKFKLTQLITKEDLVGSYTLSMMTNDIINMATKTVPEDISNVIILCSGNKHKCLLFVNAQSKPQHPITQIINGLLMLLTCFR